MDLHSPAPVLSTLTLPSILVPRMCWALSYLPVCIMSPLFRIFWPQILPWLPSSRFSDLSSNAFSVGPSVTILPKVVLPSSSSSLGLTNDFNGPTVRNAFYMVIQDTHTHNESKGSLSNTSSYCLGVTTSLCSIPFPFVPSHPFPSLPASPPVLCHPLKACPCG